MQNRHSQQIIKTLFVSIFMLLVMNGLYAGQKGDWVRYQLPDVLPLSWQRAVGENCLIYVGSDDSLIAAYDIHAGAWHTFETSIGLPWQYTAAAGDDAAMVWNDSIVVAYSALTQEFALLDIDIDILERPKWAFTSLVSFSHISQLDDGGVGGFNHFVISFQ